jgi:hypothetical protein
MGSVRTPLTVRGQVVVEGQKGGDLGGQAQQAAREARPPGWI